MTVRLENVLKRAGFTDISDLKYMDRDKLRLLLRRDPYFGMKSWNELQKLLDQLRTPWFEFAL